MRQNKAYAFEVSFDEVKQRCNAPKLLGGNDHGERNHF